MTDDDTLTEQNRELIQNMYAAAGRGDFEYLLNCLHEDVVVTEPSFLPYGGVYNGREAFVNLLGDITKNMNLSTTNVDDVLADGENVVVFFHVNSANSDNAADQIRIAERLTVKDQKVVKVHIYFHELGLLQNSMIQGRPINP